MRSIIVRSWRQAVVVALLVGLDLAVSLPIMGATYRPFSWMSIEPAGVSTLYPVFRNLTFTKGKPAMSFDVASGAHCTLQRSTNIMNVAGWTDVAATNSVGSTIVLTDTNAVTRAVYYRVKRAP